MIAAVVSTGVILALAAPALGMKLNMPDESSQARGTMGYQSYAIMADGFGPGFDAPLIVAAITALARREHRPARRGDPGHPRRRPRHPGAGQQGRPRRPC